MGNPFDAFPEVAAAGAPQPPQAPRAMAASIWDAYPEAPKAPTATQTPPREASGLLEGIQAGVQGSALGLMWRRKLPDLFINPETANWWERLASGVGQIGAELPLMVGGAIAGAPVGAAIGGGPVGALLGAGFGMGAVPATIRTAYMEALKAGEVKDAADFWRIAGEVATQAVKEGTINAAAMGAGAFAKAALATRAGATAEASRAIAVGAASPLTQKAAIGYEATDLATQIASMTTMAAWTQGHLYPSLQEVGDAAILIGGLKGAHVTAKRIMDVYEKTGKTPAEIAADAQRDPKLAEELATPKKLDPAVGETVSVTWRDEGDTDPQTKVGVVKEDRAGKYVVWDNGAILNNDGTDSGRRASARMYLREDVTIERVVPRGVSGEVDMPKIQEQLFRETARIDELQAMTAPLSDAERVELDGLKTKVTDLEAQLAARAAAPNVKEIITARYAPEQLTEARTTAEARAAELTTAAETRALTDTERAERSFIANSLNNPEALARHFKIEPAVKGSLTAEARDASAQKVYDDVLGQLKAADEARQAAGLKPLGDDHAEAVATLVRARVRTRAARLGMLPEEVYNEKPLQIRDETAAEVAAAEAAIPANAVMFVPPEVDLFGDPVQVTNAPRHAVENLATSEIPLANLVLSKEVPQFKNAADANGVVAPLGGRFDRTGVGPIQVWERLDGTLEVISGRHRLDLARRTGEETIPAQIHREADGFTAKMAAALDAELNIRDEQGSVADYAQYFKDSGKTREAADLEGLLGRAKGKAGFAIARDASPDLLAAHRAGKLSDEAALSISSAAPGSERLQALGIASVNNGKSILVAVNTMKAVDLMAAERMAAGAQGDIFGFDDSAMQEAAAMAKKASSKQRAISEQISAVSGASKRPELARKLGVDVQDPEGIQKKIVELKQEQYLWDNWPLYPELVAKLRELNQGPVDTEAPAFKAWFAGSKAVDSTGAPLRVFRGRAPESGDIIQSPVAYFAMARRPAEEYARQHDTKPLFDEDGYITDERLNVLEAYLSIKNPASEADVERVAAKYGIESHIGFDTGRPAGYLEHNPELVAALKAEGFDGTYGWDDAPDAGGEIMAFGVFDSRQVKSVDNRGTFDPNDPNILHQAETPSEAAKRDDEAVAQAVRRMAGPDSPGFGVAAGNALGFWPDLRVRVQPGLRIPDKPQILQTTNNLNAPRQLAALDPILDAFRNATDTIQNWTAMMAHAFASREVPVPPYAFIRDINGPQAVEKLRRLTAGQIADADHGFQNAAEFRRAYTAGELGVETTGKLFMWSFLSRGVSPYTQESLFIDAFKGADEWIAKAARGEFTEADFPAYTEWAKSVAPAGSGQPGSGATHNLNAFGRNFLFKMGQMDADGKSHLQRLHDMMADPNTTGREIRREFAKFGEGVGIDNKVVSFTLLVAGHADVMVLDRVQIRNLWDDGRFGDINLYDGATEKRMVQNQKTGKLEEQNAKIAGSALTELAEGVRGLLVYEALERGLAAKLPEIYGALGRPQDASLGRYHWETWVAASEQEASHGTLGAILRDAKGDDIAIGQVSAKQGEYGAYEYGAEYHVRDGSPGFDYRTPSGKQYEFSVPAFRAFLDGVRDTTASGPGIIPRGFLVTNKKKGADGKLVEVDAGYSNRPWYDRPGVNNEKLDELASKWADRSGGSGEGERALAEAAAAKAPADRERSPEEVAFANEGNPNLLYQSGTRKKRAPLSVQRMFAEAETLDAMEKRVDKAYERGDPRAEDLDAELAQRRSDLEDGGDLEPAMYDETGVSEQLVRAYRDWSAAPANRKAEIVDHMRAVIEDNGGQPGTAAELIAAAKDAHDARIDTNNRRNGGATDAAGNVLYQSDKPDSPEFRKWFDKSKVADENGAPIQAVHMTNADFSVFSHEAQDTARGTWDFEKGEPKQPGGYTTAYGKQFVFPRDGFFFFVGDVPPNAAGRTTSMPVYLAIKNPLDLTKNIPPEDAAKIIEWLKEKNNRAPSPGMAGFTVRGDTIGGFRNAKKNGMSPEQLWNFLDNNSFTDRGRLFNELLEVLGKDGLLMEANSSGTSILEPLRGRGDGKTYKVAVALKDTQVKSVFNRGTWDQNDPNILHQPDEAANARGSFQIAANLITTMQGADKSTVVHELGHSWLEEMKADALRENAPLQIKADWDILRAELAIGSDGQISRESHEQWARTVERYLAEGEAPSVELRGVFDRFRAWLLEIYNSLGNLRAEVNPELKGILDRMLATDQEIAMAKELDVPRAYVPEANAARIAAIVPPEQRAKILPGFEAERAAMEPFTDELPTGPGEAPDTTRVNYQYINAPEDVKRAMQGLAEIDQANIQKRRGGEEGVESWEATNEKVAKEMADVLEGDPRALDRYVNDVLGASTTQPKVNEVLRRMKIILTGAAKDSAARRDVILAKGLDASIKEQLEYLGSLERLRMIQNEFLGQRAAVARALNQLKDTTEGTGEVGRMLEAIGVGADDVLLQSGRTPEQEQAAMKASLDEILLRYKDKSGNLRTPLDIAKLHKEIGSLKGSFKLAETMEKAGTWEKFVEGWKAGLLSGPQTPVVNLFGTASFEYMRPAVDALAAIIGMARGASPGMGESDRASMSEAVARLTGMTAGIQDGLKVGYAALKVDQQTGKVEAYRPAIEGRLGEVIRIPYRLMAAGDQITTTMYMRGELATLAIRQAFDEGLSPNSREFAERVQALKDKPTPEMQAAAETAAARMTFNRPGGEKMRATQAFVSKWHLEWMVPFIRTPLNVAEEMLRMSPFAPAVSSWRADIAKGGVARDRAIAELTLGAGIMALTTAYAFSGQISGSGSPDPGKNRAKAGVWQNNSILIGDTWYEYGRIQPVGTLMALAADMATTWDMMNDEERDKIPKMLALAFSNAITNQTFLQGITNVVHLMSEPDRYGGRFLQGLAGSMVPNVIGQPTAMSDPYVRQVNSMLEAVQSRIPGLRQDLAPKIDWLGEPVPTKERLGVVGPVREQPVSQDKVRQEADRLGISVADAPKKTQIGKGTGKTGQVEFTPEERTKFAQIGGEFAHKILGNIVNAEGYDAIPDRVKKQIFSKVMTAAHKVAAIGAMPMEKRMAYLQEITEKVAQELTPGVE